MSNPNIRQHGRLTATRVSVPDALAFLTEHATSVVPGGGRFAVAVTAQTRPAQTPEVVAAAVAGRHRGFGGTIATVAVAFTDPTARMRRMLIAAVWNTARAMGYQALFVEGDYRYPGSRETEIYPRSLDRRSRHRRSRSRGLDLHGRPVTRQLIERPDIDGEGAVR